MTEYERSNAPEASALPTFFCADLAGGGTGDEVHLDAEEAGHARVRRLAPGDEVALVDGRGLRWLAGLERVDRDGARCTLRRVAPGEERPRARLWAPVGNKERALWLVEKAVELGVAEIRFVEWDRSRSVADAGRSRGFMAKCVRRARSALKQCGGTWLPDVEGPDELDGALDSLDGPDRRPARWLLDASGASPLGARVGGDGVLIVAGPEGGPSPVERDRVLGCGFEPVALGPRVLRFETAAVAGLALANTRLERDAPSERG